MIWNKDNYKECKQTVKYSGETRADGELISGHIYELAYPEKYDWMLTYATVFSETGKIIEGRDLKPYNYGDTEKIFCLNCNHQQESYWRCSYELPYIEECNNCCSFDRNTQKRVKLPIINGIIFHNDKFSCLEHQVILQDLLKKYGSFEKIPNVKKIYFNKNEYYYKIGKILVDVSIDSPEIYWYKEITIESLCKKHYEEMKKLEDKITIHRKEISKIKEIFWWENFLEQF